MKLKNKNELLEKINPLLKNQSTDKIWCEEAKILIINNFQKNISLEQLIFQIKMINSNTEKEACIKATSINILKSLSEIKYKKTLKNKLNIELVIGKTGSGKTEYIKSNVSKLKAKLICYKNLKSNYSNNFNFININKYIKEELLSFQNQIIIIDDFEDLEKKDFLIEVLNSLYKNQKEIFIKNKWYISLKSHEILNKIPWLNKCI